MPDNTVGQFHKRGLLWKRYYAYQLQGTIATKIVIAGTRLMAGTRPQ